VIIDTSALVAIIDNEPESAAFGELIASTDVCRLSVASRLELAMVLDKRQGRDTERRAERFLESLRIVEEPVTIQQGLLARDAFFDYGKGRHPAGLNFGDCFAYALAKAMNEPLLYKGSNFARTDVVPAYKHDLR
jgi:ribonuclease VapC